MKEARLSDGHSCVRGVTPAELMQFEHLVVRKLTSAKTAVTQHAIFHGLTCYFFFNMLEFKFRVYEINLACWNTNLVTC